MHIAIDIIAAIVLLFFLLSGSHKGFILSALGVVRVIMAYGIAYFSGRYLGGWLAELMHRPRLVIIPICTIMAFALVVFIFHIIMYEIRIHHKTKEKEEDFQRPIFSCFAGGVISLLAGTFSLVILFWLVDLFLAGMAGTSIPGADQAYFGRFARRTVYEVAYKISAKKDNASQASAIAHVISDPSKGMKYLEGLLSADSIQQLSMDKTFAADLLSGDAARIEQNPSVQRVFNDEATLDNLRGLGVLSGYETKQGLCEKMASFSQNETIQNSIQNLKAQDLLHTDEITTLVRSPDFDIILREILK